MLTTAKIEKVYSPAPDLAKTDRQKADGGDQGAGEHRKGGRGVGEGRRPEAIPALLHLHHHHLDGDDRVVDQQAERDHQRAQGNALQVDAEEAHAEGR